MTRSARAPAGLCLLWVAAARAADDRCGAATPGEAARTSDPPPAGVSLLQVQGSRVAARPPAKKARVGASAGLGGGPAALVETAALERRVTEAQPGAYIEGEGSEEGAPKWVYNMDDASGDKPKVCTTTWKDPRARGWWKWTAKPGTRCCFSCDWRTRKGNCIRDTYFGDNGWCYTKWDKSEWGSCSEDCPWDPPGQESVSSCTTTYDPVAKDWWPKMSAPGTPCVFSSDFRDEGRHCIPEFQYGSRGWCYTRHDQTAWGSCDANCISGSSALTESDETTPPPPIPHYNSTDHLAGLRALIQEVMDGALQVMEKKINESLSGGGNATVQKEKTIDLATALKPLKDAIDDAKKKADDTKASVEEIKACVKRAHLAAASSREEANRHGLAVEALINKNQRYLKNIYHDVHRMAAQTITRDENDGPPPGAP